MKRCLDSESYCPVWFDTTYDAKEWLQLTRPCVYAWFREGQCLYVGCSYHGIVRPLDRKHHVIGLLDAVLPDDVFKIFYPPVKDRSELEAVETLYIKTLRPSLNKAKNENVSRTDLQESKVHEGLSTKAQLADILYTSMQDGTLLGDTRNCSEEELRIRLARIKQVRRIAKENPDFAL